jgi:hypothetical protein
MFSGKLIEMSGSGLSVAFGTAGVSPAGVLSARVNEHDARRINPTIQHAHPLDRDI